MPSFVNKVFRDLDFILVHIEDVLAASESETEHLQLLKVVFERLDEYDLNYKLNKCIFRVINISFLDHNILKKKRTRLLGRR